MSTFHRTFTSTWLYFLQWPSPLPGIPFHLDLLFTTALTDMAASLPLLLPDFSITMVRCVKLLCQLNHRVIPFADKRTRAWLFCFHRITSTFPSPCLLSSSLSSREVISFSPGQPISAFKPLLSSCTWYPIISSAPASFPFILFYFLNELKIF